jgi:hypothetical protein
MVINSKKEGATPSKEHVEKACSIVGAGSNPLIKYFPSIDRSGNSNG